MVKTVRLRFENASDGDRWLSYVGERPDAHCADLPRWRLLFRELYGFEDLSYLCLDQDRIVGALSLYHIRSPLMGRMLVTCPFFGCGGLYWDHAGARDALLEEAAREARRLGVDYVEIRSRTELPAPYRANPDFAEFELDLAATPEETWTKRMSSNVRQNVRKARGQDLEFRLSRDPAPCFDLLRRTLRAHGTPFHGRRFFDLLQEHLASRVLYAEVWHRKKLVAGGITVRFAGSLITPYIGSLHACRGLRPNYLQYWGLIEHCHAEGIERFDMGRSPRGSTHARFKKKWGCRERPVFYNYLEIDPRRPYCSVSQPSRTQRLATEVWKKLPLGVTTRLGPWLFRYIP